MIFSLFKNTNKSRQNKTYGDNKEIFLSAEWAAIDVVAQALPLDAATLFKAQIAHISIIQRFDLDREVNLFAMRGGSPYMPEELLFSDRREECDLARVALLSQGGESSEVRIVLVKGRVFSLLFSRPQSELLSWHEDDASSYIHATIQELFNPIETEGKKECEFCDNAALLDEWGGFFIKATARACRENVSLPDGLPRDYGEICLVGGRLLFDGGTVLGWEETYEIQFQGVSYTVLAELEDCGVLSVEKGSSLGKIFFIDYEGQLKKLPYEFLKDAISECRRNSDI